MEMVFEKKRWVCYQKEGHWPSRNDSCPMTIFEVVIYVAKLASGMAVAMATPSGSIWKAGCCCWTWAKRFLSFISIQIHNMNFSIMTPLDGNKATWKLCTFREANTENNLHETNEGSCSSLKPVFHWPTLDNQIFWSTCCLERLLKV